MPVFYVNGGLGDCAGNAGRSWEDALCSPQDGIDAADLYLTAHSETTGCEVWVAQGTYTPEEEFGGSGDRYKTFVLKSRVDVYGGFAGTEWKASQRNIDANPTVLSGDLGVGGDSADNAYHVITASGIEEVTLNGVTVINGNASGNAEFGNTFILGGGMYCEGASVRVARSTFRYNEAWDSGAGLCATSESSIFVSNSVFEDNVADGGGGGIANQSSSVVVKECAFAGNSGGGDGGGIDSWSPSETSQASLAVVRSTFSSNSAGISGGGGIYSWDSSLLVTHCLFEGNSGYQGGGIRVSRSTSRRSRSAPETRDLLDALISNSVFEGNLGDMIGGGAYISGSGYHRIVNCTFSNNHAEEEAGGIAFGNGAPEVVNSVVWGNRAPTDPQLTAKGDGHDASVTYSDVEGGYMGQGNDASYPAFANAPGATYWTTQASAELDEVVMAGHGDAALGKLIEIDDDGVLREVVGLDGDIVSFTPPRTAEQGVTPQRSRVDIWDFEVTVADVDLRLAAGSPCLDAGENSALPDDFWDLDLDGVADEPTPLDFLGQQRVSNSVVDLGAFERVE